MSRRTRLVIGFYMVATAFLLVSSALALRALVDRTPLPLMYVVYFGVGYFLGGVGEWIRSRS